MGLDQVAGKAAAIPMRKNHAKDNQEYSTDGLDGLFDRIR
jgi:hypothetical protein